MLKHAFILFIVFCLSMPAWGQSAAVASDLAQRLSQVQEFPTNVRLRFQILAAEVDELEGNSPMEDVLHFFSDTRVMVWNRPASPNVQQTMRSFEDQVVALAAARGRHLDLHGVGYAPLPQSRLLSTERVTATGLTNVTLATEQAASNALAANSSADLLFLRDNLTRMREDLTDGNLSANSVRSVMGARARYLAGAAAGAGSEPLMQNLNVLGEILRANFPPDRLRENAQGTFSL